MAIQKATQNYLRIDYEVKAILDERRKRLSAERGKHVSMSDTIRDVLRHTGSPIAEAAEKQ